MKQTAASMRSKASKGFTLIEVLIALVIFTIGLMGLAAMMVTSVKTNHSSYLRTQAGHLAQAMADRMRSNLGQVNAYNGSYNPLIGVANPCGSTAPCPPVQLVQRDLSVWLGQIRALLPNPAAQIECNVVTLGAGVQIGAAPYNGVCTIWLRWDESSLREGAATRDRMEFAWVFQP